MPCKGRYARKGVRNGEGCGAFWKHGARIRPVPATSWGGCAFYRVPRLSVASANSNLTPARSTLYNYTMLADNARGKLSPSSHSPPGSDRSGRSRWPDSYIRRMNVDTAPAAAHILTFCGGPMMARWAISIGMLPMAVRMGRLGFSRSVGGCVVTSPRRRR